MKRRFTLAAIIITALLLGCGSADDKSVPTAQPDVAAGPDPVASCLALVAKKNWSEALAPCTEAANLKPDDLRIKHAVQQAQAAAGS